MNDQELVRDCSHCLSRSRSASFLQVSGWLSYSFGSHLASRFVLQWPESPLLRALASNNDMHSIQTSPFMSPIISILGFL
jgi:hypothetical protein